MFDHSVIAGRFNDWKHPFVILLLIGLILRLIIAPLFTFNIDVGYWSDVVDVFQNGFGLYGTAGYYYTPIWGYYMGSIASFMEIFGITDYGVFVPELNSFVYSDFSVFPFVTSIEFNFIVKLPLILVDAATGWLIYYLVSKHFGDQKKALLAFALWFFCPLVITESTFHGTFDNMSVMMLLAAIALMMDGKYTLAGAAFSAASLTKFFPVFMIFFLVAYVLRKEGLDSKGVRCVLKAVGGAIGAFLITYLPNILRGDFWQSLFFLTSRIGFSKETLSSIGVGTTLAIIIAIVAIIGLVAFVISRYGSRFMSRMNSMDERERNMRAAKGFAIAAAVVILVVAAMIVVKGLLTTDGPAFGGGELPMLVSVFSIFLEMYLAFRLLMLKEMTPEKVFTIMFLSGIAIVLWTSPASYMIIMLPFISIYAAMIDNSFVRPYLIFTIFYTLTETASFILSPTSMIIHLLDMDISVILPLYDIIANPVLFGISGALVITVIMGWPGYLALLYISFKWYRGYYKRCIA
ncbi:MAG: hypothetical protein IKQ93_00415 [Candidatus Methanomethylophilaceae archaeon]|nr:hypothetical protein [Candidatus Methanomethylophilaceae archaeon]